MSVPGTATGVRRGRGAASNATGRFESLERHACDDGWGSLDEPLRPLATSVSAEAGRTAITWNDSPDIPFDRSINPYRGCEHGCVYCYARPSHAYLGLSPGLDFETRLFYKPQAAELLRRELARPGYRCAPVAIGGNTDGYQPVERRLRITRAVLEVLAEHRHPVRIITKSSLVERDADVLERMAAERLCAVHVSITTLDGLLGRRMEPRATAPQRRVETVRRLAERGIPVGVLAAPMIPALNDAELEDILGAARAAGAREARYILVRLPRELSALFEEWLRAHYPQRADRVLNRIRDTRGGRLYRGGFGERMRGRGAVAELIRRRFELACTRLGFPGIEELDAASFAVPGGGPAQLAMF